jgi:cation diffusion facilitator family transporter
MKIKERYYLTKKVAWVGTVANSLLAITKISVGLIGQSSALFADGIHSVADLLGNAMVFIANHYSRLDPDDNHPYGHWRFETVATLGLGIFLLIVGLSIGYDAIHHILFHSIDKPDVFTIWAAVFSILVNEGVFRYSLNIATKIKSDMLKANAYHSRGDSLASVIVLAGLLGSLAGFTFLDAVAAVVVAWFIVRMGISWSWKACAELSDMGISKEELKKVRTSILSLPGVKHLHQLRTRRMAGKIFLDVHILIEPYLSASEGHYISQTVQVELIKKFPEIEDVLVHVDTENHPEELPKKLLPDRKTLLNELMPKWQAIAECQDIAVNIFYFQDYLEIEAILPLSSLQAKSSVELQQLFNESIQSVKEVRSIKLCFE